MKISEEVVSEYNPLGTCPPELRERYEKTSENAKKGHFTAICRLKCLDCVAWNSGEVGRCDIKGCALWPFAMKFGK